MKIDCIGGGPAGLYFALLMKQLRPAARITVHERNRADDTFGWGVVFSDETLGHFRDADPWSYDEIRRHFAYWSDIETYFGGTVVRSTGHGFCGLARKKLLEIFHQRCTQLGVELRFQQEVKSLDDLRGSDLVVACDGLNSFVREQFAAQFEPSIDWRKARFCWLGTTRPLHAFTFVFLENEHGVFQVHAYPFEQGLSTWIVECHEDVWRRAGLDQATEARTVEYCQDLFAEHLDGHPLLTNRSIWRSFPTVSCRRWAHENIVLMGDAAHTAHFSIGSGTKLALEDAIALRDAFAAHAGAPVPEILTAYEDSRRVDVIKVQKAAQTSLEWFENSARYMKQDPLLFQFNLMTRSKQITYDNLAVRDPELVAEVTRHFAAKQGMAAAANGVIRAPMFAPLRLRGIELENRVAVSAMCQYSARDGVPGDWHLVHLGARAVGGAGLVMTEMTNVSAQGRITTGCTGIYSDAQEQAFTRIVDFVHRESHARIGLQLGHAGRKGSCHLPWEGDDPLQDERAWTVLGPSPLPFAEGWPVPHAMEEADMDGVVAEYVQATARARRAGFDLIEIHFAHGYLLSSFLSPACNVRTDAYGGCLENRLRFPLRVFDAVREAWPEDRPLAVRVSASDWLEDEPGITLDETVQIARVLEEHGCDLIDVSSAGNTPRSKPLYGRMYQVPFAERIKYEVGIPVMAVGAILGADHVNTILAAERADLCALARPHLIEPHLTLQASITYDNPDHPWPLPYLPARPARWNPSNPEREG